MRSPLASFPIRLPLALVAVATAVAAGCASPTAPRATPTSASAEPASAARLPRSGQTMGTATGDTARVRPGPSAPNGGTVPWY